MLCSVTHNFNRRGGRAEVTAFVANGINLPMKPMVAIAECIDGEISFDSHGSMILVGLMLSLTSRIADITARDLKRKIMKYANR
jgi:hypothetical protein